MLKNTQDSYGLVARIFHWLMSIMIIILLTVGLIMTSMEPSDQKWEIYGMHKATGVVILFLACLRLLWRGINSAVTPPAGLNNLQMVGAKIVHYLLYICMFLMPISGIFMSLYGAHDIHVFGLFTIPAFEQNKELSGIFQFIHHTTAFILISLIVLHFAAAIYHHFIRKDNVLTRMIR